MHLDHRKIPIPKIITCPKCQFAYYSTLIKCPSCGNETFRYDLGFAEDAPKLKDEQVNELLKTVNPNEIGEK